MPKRRTHISRRRDVIAGTAFSKRTLLLNCQRVIPKLSVSLAVSANFITIVSGLPRSGTSLMMQMLQAGGLPLLTDGVRAPDESNPRGYFEHEAVKHSHNDVSWLDHANGKAVKVI